MDVRQRSPATADGGAPGRPSRRAAPRLGCALRRGVWGLALWGLAVWGSAGAAAAQPASVAPSAVSSPAVASADRELREIEDMLAAAHFRTVLGLAPRTRERIAAIPDPEMRGERSARLDVLVATAALALGDPGRARARLMAALRADAGLELDPQTTSPKVLEIFYESRRLFEAP